MVRVLQKYKILFLITLIAFLLRFIGVTNVPPSLSWDEVSIGYNAYSIIKSGRDEHGVFLPLAAFAGYGDYKPPVAIYLTVPFVALFGLNEFAVRLPVIIISSIAIPLLFFVGKELFSEKNKLSISFIASGLVAVSPWHIQLSRANYEATIALTFILLGVYVSLLARQQLRLRLVMFIPFVISMYTFNSSRYFAPLISIVLLVYNFRHFRINSKYLVMGFVVAFVLLIPLVPHIFSKEGQLRFKEVNIFSNVEVVKTSNNRIEELGSTWWSKMLFNRRIGYVREYFIHYLDSFEPWFLFIKGDGNAKFSSQDQGQFYLVECIFLVIGIFIGFYQYRSIALVLLSWILLAIIPAAVARETPHALRILNSLSAWYYFIALGIYFSLDKIKNTKLFLSLRYGSFLSLFILIFIYCISISVFIYNYSYHYAVDYAGDWQWGYREAIQYALSEKQYTQYVLSEVIGRAYMYVLFYGKYDPSIVVSSHDRGFDAAGFYNVYGFDKWKFVRDGFNKIDSQTLYILDPSEVPSNAKIQKNFIRPDGVKVLVAFTV